VTASPERTTRLAISALLLAGTLFGLMWLPLKYFAAQGISGLVLSLMTYGSVGVLGIPILLSQFKQWRRQKFLLFAGGFFGGATNVAFVYAMMNGSVMRVMLLFYLAPIWSVLGARFLFHEVLTPLRLTAVAMAFCGAVLVLGGPGIFSTPLSIIDLVALASGVFCAGQNLSSRAAEQVPVMSKTVAILFGCGLLSALLLPLTGQAIPSIFLNQFLQLVGFGFFWLVTALWVTMYGVTHLEASRSAVLLVVELAVAVISALIIGGERLSAVGWAGAALITTAALIESHLGNTPNLTEKIDAAKC
jgi:drug/metabolite transporter (DMT)-like permease